VKLGIPCGGKWEFLECFLGGNCEEFETKNVVLSKVFWVAKCGILGEENRSFL
jgi:hypothetical protein